jgi:DNA polymerase
MNGKSWNTSLMQQNLSEHQRRQYLHALGVSIWVHRESRPVCADVDVPQMLSVPEQTSKLQPQSQGSPSQSLNATVKELSVILSADQSKPIEHDRSDGHKIAKAQETPSSSILVDCSTMNWEELQTQVSTCQCCNLYQSRSQAILGDGNTSADIMIIDDAPSFDDDRQGKPFQGKAGQLLTNMLLAIDTPRNTIYLSNNVKCRPANDRSPLKTELNTCQYYLSRQIELIKPKSILILGLVSAQHLLRSKAPLSKLRVLVHLLPDSDISVVVTYHPRYLLKQTKDKRKAWEDLKLFRHLNAQPR